MYILIGPKVEASEAAEIMAAVPGVDIRHTESEDEALRLIAEAEGFYGNLTPELLAAAKQLRWNQTPMAGLESYFYPELSNSTITITNMRGIYNDDISDTVLAYILAFARGIPAYTRLQDKRIWDPQSVPMLHLEGMTLGIVGLGGIGGDVAKRGYVLGMRVIAIDPRRTERPPEVEELWTPERLPDLLTQSDFVAVCTPQTPETTALFDEEQFRQMKNSAYFINIGRGKVVKLDALANAIRQNEIAGAALDVFEQEPLPPDSPLWDFKNVIITPHVAAKSNPTRARRIQVVADNMRRFAQGEPLRNIVDKAHWF